MREKSGRVLIQLIKRGNEKFNTVLHTMKIREICSLEKVGDNTDLRQEVFWYCAGATRHPQQLGTNF